MVRWKKAFAALLLLLALPAFGEATNLRLRWEVERNVFPGKGDGHSELALTITHLAGRPLPASGWSLYFNCIDGVKPGPAREGAVAFEQVTGTLYRMRPTAAFAGLAPGQAVTLRYDHPEVLVKPDKAPKGPYLVFDDQPDSAQAQPDARLEPLVRREQLIKSADDPAPVVTAEERYARYAKTLDLPPSALAPVFPTPRQVNAEAGALHWSGMPAIVAGKALLREAAVAQALLQPYFTGGKPGPGTLRLLTGPIEGQASPEAYEMKVDAAGTLTIRGTTAAGVFYGLQSLRELLPLAPAADGALSLSALTIADGPRFGHRGLLMDVARNFQNKAFILRLLDLMARYKMNVLHFHLTDDEGWRLAIPALPELTAVGARRGHSADPLALLPPAYGSGPDPADAHGSGHYTADEYIAILRYAAERHITVVPEIEMPGHARAAVKAMEARTRNLERAGDPRARLYLLSDPDDRSVYRSPQHYRDHVINPGLDSTYTFIDTVVAEVARLHRAAGVPLKTLHVGADELPRGAWEKSPAVHAAMARLKLADTKALWNHFYTRVEAILAKHGVMPAGWEELGTRTVVVRGQDRQLPNPAFAGRRHPLYVWNNTDGSEDLAYRLANAGRDVVLTPATHYYFDMAHNRNPEEPGTNWAAYVELDTIFGYVPFDATRKAADDPTPLANTEGLSDYGQRHILGLEGTLFSETMREPARIDYLLMPRLLALAERAWAPDPAWARETTPAAAAPAFTAAWSAFAHQLGKRVLPRLDRDMPGLAYRIAPPGLTLAAGRVLANGQLPGMALRYTTDGSAPTATSPLVTGPIAERGTIAVAAFDRNGRAGLVSRIINP